MKYIRILMGPYHGQTLQLDDDVAGQAVADEWGADTAAKDYDRFNEPPSGLGDASAYPQSLQDYLDSISGVQKQPEDKGEKKPKAHAKSEPAGKLSDDVAVTSAKPKTMPKATDEDDTNGEPAKSSSSYSTRQGKAKK